MGGLEAGWLMLMIVQCSVTCASLEAGSSLSRGLLEQFHRDDMAAQGAGKGFG